MLWFEKHGNHRPVVFKGREPLESVVFLVVRGEVTRKWVRVFLGQEGQKISRHRPEITGEVWIGVLFKIHQTPMIFPSITRSDRMSFLNIGVFLPCRTLTIVPLTGTISGVVSRL